MKIFSFLKKPFVIFIIIVAIGTSGYFYFKKDKALEYDEFTVQRGDVTQNVSVTGTIKPAESVSLAFEKSGKITRVNGKIGDKIVNGQIMAMLDNNELQAQLAQAQANVLTQKAKLDELKKGSRAEEIQIAQTTVENAKKSLADAETNLQNVKNKADADLKEDYDASLSAANDAVTNAVYSLFVLTDIQYTYFQSTSDADSINVANAKADAIYYLLGTVNAGRATNNAINQMTGGAKNDVAIALVNPTFTNIDNALSKVKTALLKVKTALDSVPTTALSSTNKTNLATEKSSVNSDITTISGKIEAISVQKATNQNNIITAEISLTSAKNTLANAEANLTLKNAGSTPEQIAAQEAQVKQAEANAWNASAQLAKTVIKSPVSGVITVFDAKLGEMATANQNIISVIADVNFEIEADISETEIAKININDFVSITLDSLGPKEKFTGKVIKIDPAETVVSGVIYYKTTCIFDNNDSRIKSGMTANLSITADEKTNVLYLPYYAIKQKNGDKYVQILKDGGFEEKIVKTGLEGETMVEITEGLQENEKVIVVK